MSLKQAVAENLAIAFLSGARTVGGMTRRGNEASGGERRWMRALARRVLTRLELRLSHLDVGELGQWICEDSGFNRVWRRTENPASLLGRIQWPSQEMSPAAGRPATWTLPSLTSQRQLADWLQVSIAELNWLADVQKRLRRSKDLSQQHYVYRWIPKRSGARRLLEIPKAKLKTAQRRILKCILDQIPPHDSAHAYRRGRSLLSYVTPHCRRDVVLQFDLCDFFASVHRSRVHAVFRTAGYPRDVARILAALCTNAAPAEVTAWSDDERPSPKQWCEERRFLSPHLPQGAPTSPALANLCAYRFDCRVAGLARNFDARYTRYADDLVISGADELERGFRRIYLHVCVIALEEGFEINTRKTRFLRRGTRQMVSGVVINEHPNVRRTEFDQLKAILHNCTRTGPEDQNREQRADFRAHLLGRISHLRSLNPQRGDKLLRLFGLIRW